MLELFTDDRVCTLVASCGRLQRECQVVPVGVLAVEQERVRRFLVFDGDGRDDRLRPVAPLGAEVQEGRLHPSPGVHVVSVLGVELDRHDDDA